MQTIVPCLFFDGKAEEAVNFYKSVFKSAKVDTSPATATTCRCRRDR